MAANEERVAGERRGRALLRTFFALELGPEARRTAAAIIRELRAQPSGESVRWVRAESLHVTLRFLGETPVVALGGLVHDVAAQVSALPPFVLGLGAVQAFPSPRRARVVALHVAPEPPLLALARAVEAGVVAAGFEPEARGFRAHLTLGRVQDGRAPALDSLAAPPPSPFEVREIVLFQSTLGAAGSIYTPLERIALGCGAAADAAPALTVHPDSGDPEETPHGNDRHHTR